MGINSDSPLTTTTKRKFRAMVDAVIFANHLEHNFNNLHHHFHPKGGVVGQLVLAKPRSNTNVRAVRKFRAAVDAVILVNHLSRKHNIQQRRVPVGQHEVSTEPFMSHEEQERCRHSLMGRKFRAAVKCVMVAQNLTTRMMIRRKFRAAVKLLIHSDHLMNRSVVFTVTTFQDAVLTAMSVRKLQQRRLQSETTRDEHLKQKLCLAVEAILQANRHVGQWTHIPRTKVSRDETWKFLQDQVELERSRKELSKKFYDVGIGNHLVGNRTAHHRNNIGTNTNAGNTNTTNTNTNKTNSKEDKIRMMYDCSPEFRTAVYHFLEEHNTA